MINSSRFARILIVAPILLLALGLRLNEMHGRSLWFDEAIEFRVATQPLSEVVATDQASTHDPPLFSLTLNLWMQAGRTDFQVRLLSVFASVLATAVTFVLGRVIFSATAGWFSALLVAVAPRSVFYGLELNQYAYVLLLTVLSTVLLERYLKRPTWVRLVLFLLTGTAAILTHYELAIYLVPLILVGTLSLMRNRVVANRRRLLTQWVGGVGVLMLAGVILLWTYALPQKARLPETFAPARFNGPISVVKEIETWVVQTDELTRTLLWDFQPAPFAWLTTVLLIVSTVACLFRPSRRLALYFIIGLALAYLMAGIGFLIYWHRYVWYAFPLEVLLICGGTFTLAGGRYRRYLTPAAYLVMSALAILLFSRLPAISGHPFLETEQFSEVMQYLQSHYHNGDAIYVYYGAKPAFTRYQTDELSKAAALQVWSRDVAPAVQQARLWKAVGDAPRVWLLMSHIYLPDASVLPDALKNRCHQTDTIQVTGSAGYLFECVTP